MNTWQRCAVFSILLAVPTALFAAKLPPYAAFPPGYVSNEGSEVFEEWGFDQFAYPGDRGSHPVEGKHWQMQFAADPPQELDGEAAWAKVKPAFLASDTAQIKMSIGSSLLMRSSLAEPLRGTVVVPGTIAGGAQRQHALRIVRTQGVVPGEKGNRLRGVV